MDRPEWVAVHPVTREAYVTLTNNSDRKIMYAPLPGGPKHPGVDAANPRAENPYGQIVRWREKGAIRPRIPSEWDIFLLAGNPHIHPEQDVLSGSANVTKDNAFKCSPDGLAFDTQGRLWIQTDGNYSNKGKYEGHGNNRC